MQNLALFLFEVIRFIDSVLVPLVFSIAFIVFLWGVFRFFIAGAEDKEKREDGKKFVMWGIIGFVLMFSLWGIVNLILNSLGFDTQHKPVLPLFGGDVGYMQGTNGIQRLPNGQVVQNNPSPIPGGAEAGACGWGFMDICPRGFDCDTARDVCVNRDGS